jgi:hypothetical protein
VSPQTPSKPPVTQPVDDLEKGFGTGLREKLERKAPPAKPRRAGPQEPARKPAAKAASPKVDTVDREQVDELARRSAVIDSFAAELDEREM